jgi:two-component system, LytTR family, response regulator LytT
MAVATATLTALIIDDEPLARQELRYLLERTGGVEIVAEGSNGIEAVDLIRTHRPGVVFLDVRMPGLDGFAVLRKVISLDRESARHDPLPQIVFATAYDQYAVRAFEVNAVDYLLKPFDTTRVVRTLEKLRRTVGLSGLSGFSGSEVRPEPGPKRLTSARVAVPERAPEQPRFAESEASPDSEASAPIRADAPQPGTSRLLQQLVPAAIAGAEAKLDALLRMLEGQSQPVVAASPAQRAARVVVRVGSRLMLVDQKDVCFASIDEGRIAVVTTNFEGESNVRTLEELQDQLDPELFWRAHRSCLINLQHIREVVPWFKSSYQLRMDDRKATELPVSRTQTKRLRELFNL